MYELVGFQHVDIPAKSRGDSDVVGYSCWFLMQENNPEFTGRSGVKVFFSDERFPDFGNRLVDEEFKLGDKFLLIFNQKGKLQAYQKLDG